MTTYTLFYHRLLCPIVLSSNVCYLVTNICLSRKLEELKCLFSCYIGTSNKFIEMTRGNDLFDLTCHLSPNHVPFQTQRET